MLTTIRPDLSTLSDADIGTREFDATVISAHDFGIFAELDELVLRDWCPPVSKLLPSCPVALCGTLTSTQFIVDSFIGSQRMLNLVHYDTLYFYVTLPRQ
jgi:hypothetical protein